MVERTARKRWLHKYDEMKDVTAPHRAAADGARDSARNEVRILSAQPRGHRDLAPTFPVDHHPAMMSRADAAHWPATRAFGESPAKAGRIARHKDATKIASPRAANIKWPQ